MTSPLNNLTLFARGGGCFVAGTLIDTPNGQVAIETLNPGDMVISFNESTGKNEESKIGKIDVLQRDHYVSINNAVKATMEHPFYTTDGIKEVEKLDVGDRLIGRYGEEIKVSHIKINFEDVTVYNLLDVEPNNNYYANQFLVHNKGGGGCFLKGTKVRTPTGQKPIDKLKIGDMVVSQNELTRQDEASEIGRIDVLSVRGYYIINGHLKVTGTHPIYIRSGIVQSLCSVENLRIGHEMVTDAGTQTVTKIEYFDKEVTVYNLIDVAPNHNYYANNILVHNKGGGGGRGGSSAGKSSSSSSKSSSSSSKSIAPARPKVGTSTAKPGSKIKTADGKEIQSSAKAPADKKFTDSRGVVGDNGYAPRFSNGYSAPPGSVVYYPQHSALDYLPWIYLFSRDSPQNDQVTTVQPDGKEVQAQPIREGADGLAVFNWFLLIVIAIAIIGGVMYGVNKLASKKETVKKQAYNGW